MGVFLDLLPSYRREEATEQLGKLTPREMDVLKLIVNGLSNKAAGKVLGISPRTIEVHRASIMEKLRVGTSNELVRLVVELDLIPGGRKQPEPHRHLVDCKVLGHRVLEIRWDSGLRHAVDLAPRVLKHLPFIELSLDDELFGTARVAESGECVQWANGSKLPVSWLARLPAVPL